MKYVGIQTQKRRNNCKSTFLLVTFPCVMLGLVWIFLQIIVPMYNSHEALVSVQTGVTSDARFITVKESFIQVVPFVVSICGIWFIIAYFCNTSMIKAATGAKSLERRENKRIYNLVENLCIASGLKMPKINIIDDPSLNAFASGINEKTYTVTLSTGIIEKLNDDELEAVIAHELTHIKNGDVRLLIVAIIFVGIFSFVTHILFRSLRYGNIRVNNGNRGGGGIIFAVLLASILASIGYFLTLLMRFAISRQREYMADAGSAEMTKNPLALASALRKISADPVIEAVSQSDVAQLFIENPMEKGRAAVASLFATHPPIEDRIAVLEQF